MWRNTSNDAWCVKQIKLTCTTKNHTYTPLPQTQKHNHLKSLPWTSSQSYHRRKGTTQYSPSWTTTAPRQPYSSCVTKPSQVKESRNYTSNMYTPTTVYQNR